MFPELSQFAGVTCDTHPLPLQELVLSVKGLPRLARFLPKVMLALLVSASAEGYKKLAIWLNDMGTPWEGRSHCLPPMRQGPTALWGPCCPWGSGLTPSFASLAPRKLPAGERL